MDQEKLNNLIFRLEDYARRQPAAARLRDSFLLAVEFPYVEVGLDPAGASRFSPAFNVGLDSQTRWNGTY
jgi:hypothetical protein